MPSIQNLDRLRYDASTTTDVKNGLDRAQAEFKYRGRPNAQKVTVVFASGPRTSISTKQYNDNTILYQINQEPSFLDFNPKWGRCWAFIANGTARINSRDDNGHALVDALCDANCRCPQNYLPSLKDPKTKAPIGGCYRPFTSLANLQVHTLLKLKSAKRMGKTADQTYFLASLYRNNTNLLAGLKWNNNGYYWLDGTSVNSTSYQPWYGGQAPQHLNGQDCVYVLNSWAPSQWQNSQQWVPNDCRNGFAYVCETTVCDSTHYCN